MLRRPLVALPLMSCLATPAYGGDIRLRAREHYEVLEVAGDGFTSTYSGFTNTLDLWYEVPFRYSLGLAGSPLFATLHSRNAPPGVSQTVRLVHLGVEGKVFPLEDVGIFARLGTFASTLSSYSTAGTLNGESVLGGLGYEWKLGGVGLALELDVRDGRLAQHVSFSGTAPCVGVHFYKMLE